MSLVEGSEGTLGGELWGQLWGWSVRLERKTPTPFLLQEDLGVSFFRLCQTGTVDKRVPSNPRSVPRTSITERGPSEPPHSTTPMPPHLRLGATRGGTPNQEQLGQVPPGLTNWRGLWDLTGSHSDTSDRGEVFSPEGELTEGGCVSSQAIFTICFLWQ